MPQKYIRMFDDVDRNDTSIVGGKGANLGEMVQAGFPVPSGFIITSQAYRDAISENQLEHKLRGILHGLDINNAKALETASQHIQHLISHVKLSHTLSQEIIRAYMKLGRGFLHMPYVAVRSSATAEDLPGASFAGQQATFLNVRGESSVVQKVREAWASLFTARAIFYRATQGYDHMKVAIAIPVQKMVQSDISGIMFTVDPVTNDPNRVVIEAIYGLGEPIVQGSITPDHYVIDKKSGQILEKHVEPQKQMLTMGKHLTRMATVPKKLQQTMKLTDTQMKAVGALGIKLQKHYYFPQDIEWAIEKGKLYVVQTRPITTLQPNKNQDTDQAKTRVYPQAALLLKGDPASPGIASGPVKILRSIKELHKIVTGDILVADMTNPDYVPAMRRAVAIVTARGGRTSHAAIVSREMGIPAVVGVSGALTTLKDGLIITVNGLTGEIYKGSVHTKPSPDTTSLHSHNIIKTATKVLVNLADPTRAQTISKLNVDGVGLMRAEFIISHIGTHPKKFIEDKREKDFIKQLADGMGQICRAFHPRTVVYRATDFRTNEFRNLKGGQAYEPAEENPMLGFRGAARYIADPRVFEMELSAIKEVRNKMGLKNIYLMIPFVRTPTELSEVKKIVAASGLSRSSSFKLWLMVELPTNVILIDKFLDVGIDGISFGSNDLTMLILGIDRDNSEVAKGFNELDESVLWCFERVIKACNKRGITSSMCGQAPSDYPELVDKLVRWGITSISISADAVDRMRETIYEAEKSLVRRSHVS